jgi:putative restriction endonuclease
MRTSVYSLDLIWIDTRHSLRASPSVQIDRNALLGALQYGLAFDRKGNGEIAVGIRPDHLLLYADNAVELHAAGADNSALEALRAAAETWEIEPIVLDQVAEPRRRIVQQVSRYSRGAGFRAQVLQAYDNRCAVTRFQLRLVEAAHILPVQVGPDSPDLVTNGIALTPSYHLAFDRALIYLDTDFSMNLNPSVANELEEAGLDSGLSEFTAGLGRIHLPLDPQQWPDRGFIDAGNEFRRIDT